VGQPGQALLYLSGDLNQRAGAPVTLACHVGVVMPCRNEGPLVMTTVWLGEPMVDVLRREPPRVRPQGGLRLRRSKEAIVVGLDIYTRDVILFDII
jgi:hypothetical protein